MYSCTKQKKRVGVCVHLCARAVENWDTGTSNQIVLTGTAQFLQRSVIPVATAVHTAHTLDNTWVYRTTSTA